MTYLRIAPESEPRVMSVQVREPAMKDRGYHIGARECGVKPHHHRDHELPLNFLTFIQMYPVFRHLPVMTMKVCNELSVCPVTITEVIPLSAALPVLGVGR